MADIFAGGVRFHVQRLIARRPARGSAHPVVFIHGLGMDNLSSYYYTLANPVSHAGTEVILYDLRGHGLSERPPTGYRTDDSVADLAAILDTLGVEGPVHLVGNSYGGRVVLAFAVAHPERVASTLLIEATASTAGWTEQIAAERTKFESGNDLRGWLDQLGRKAARLADMADKLLNHTTFLADLGAMQPIPMSQLSTLSCPVRAVYGAHSPLVDYARQLNDHLPHCDLTVLPGYGHSVLMDATPQVRAIALEWFSAQSQVGVG